MVITDEFIYAANPRTASRSTEKLLKRLLGDRARVTRVHHPKTNHPALSTNLPIYGVVRNPLDCLVSWYHHIGKPGTFREFLEIPSRNWLLKDRLNIYASYITHPLLFDIGVTNIIHAMIGPPFEGFLYNEPMIGVTGSERTLWTQELEDIARARFNKDFELYESLCYH